MKISVKVITGAKQEKLERLRDNEYKIHLTSIAEKGKANKALIELISKHFDIRKRDIEIISGEKSHNKIIEIKNGLK